MLVDYHIHTKMCGHASGDMEEYLATAKRLGIGEIGFADHLPLYFLAPEKRPPGYAMNCEELPDYVAAVVRLQEKSGGVRIKLGIEADYAPGFAEQLSKILKSQAFDYVLGSVHFLDGWSFDNEEEIDQYNNWKLMDLYDLYFTYLQQAADSGCFDVMAHPDLIKKFGFVPDGSLLPLYEDTLRVFKRAGVCMEVNTAGLRYPIGEFYPAPTLLRMAVRRGVPLTLGSDAHKPDQVGAGFGTVIAFLKEIDCHELTLFDRRRRSVCRIDG